MFLQLGEKRSFICSPEAFEFLSPSYLFTVLHNTMGGKMKSAGFTIHVVTPFINNDYLSFSFFKGFFYTDKCSDSESRIASEDVRKTVFLKHS